MSTIIQYGNVAWYYIVGRNARATGLFGIDCLFRAGGPSGLGRFQVSARYSDLGVQYVHACKYCTGLLVEHDWGLGYPCSYSFGDRQGKRKVAHGWQWRLLYSTLSIPRLLKDQLRRSTRL